jgi:acyl carrier protein
MSQINQIKDEIAEFLDMSVDRLADRLLLNDLVPDSFLLVELVVHLQHQFGFEVSSEEAEAVSTVGELVRLVESRVNG